MSDAPARTGIVSPGWLQPLARSRCQNPHELTLDIINVAVLRVDPTRGGDGRANCRGAVCRGRRDARHVVGREDDDRKRPGDMSEAREEQLREMVRKAIKEVMK